MTASTWTNEIIRMLERTPPIQSTGGIVKDFNIPKHARILRETTLIIYYLTWKSRIFKFRCWKESHSLCAIPHSLSEALMALPRLSSGFLLTRLMFVLPEGGPANLFWGVGSVVRSSFNLLSPSVHIQVVTAHLSFSLKLSSTHSYHIHSLCPRIRSPQVLSQPCVTFALFSAWPTIYTMGLLSFSTSVHILKILSN